MIYIIDHNDSFTHNVVHQFQNFDDVECDNFNEINHNKLKKSNVIVFGIFQKRRGFFQTKPFCQLYLNLLHTFR